jgi:hypothetical protein
MRAVAWLILAVLMLGATACGSSKSSEPAHSSQADSKTMPNVTGKNLQVAEDAIKSAGGDPDKIKIIGGGTFGVVVKSNWQVCSQSPDAGMALPVSPQLTVDRSCSVPSPASSSPASSSSASSGSATAAPLTAKNRKDLAALLKVGDYCDPTVKTFATKYAGREIEFDGSISALNRHGSYKTRYDIGIAPGDKGANSSAGPFFQFQNVNTTTDLHLTGANLPDSLKVGDKLHVVAQVDAYNSANCLFYLTPVSTQIR